MDAELTLNQKAIKKKEKGKNRCNRNLAKKTANKT